jgi:hypothetical protein
MTENNSSHFDIDVSFNKENEVDLCRVEDFEEVSKLRDSTLQIENIDERTKRYSFISEKPLFCLSAIALFCHQAIGAFSSEKQLESLGI